MFVHLQYLKIFNVYHRTNVYLLFFMLIELSNHTDLPSTLLLSSDFFAQIPFIYRSFDPQTDMLPKIQILKCLLKYTR